MIDLIFLIILLVSFIGMAIIVFRKIPALNELSVQENKGLGVLEKVKDRIKNNGSLKTLSKEALLHRVLSKFRILTLKTESKTADWLKELREKSIEKKNSFRDDYWQRLRKKK